MRLRAMVLCAACAAACGGDPAVSVFVGRGAASTPETFYDLPFPNDARRQASGLIDLTGFPAQTPIVEQYIAAIEGSLDGFGLNSGIFLRFDGELDESGLPDAAGSVGEDAAVYLV